jgi:hypothetical protein
MNWKGCGKKLSWPNSKYYLDIFLERLNKTMKNRIVIVPTEIWTGLSLNKNQKCYSFS